MCAWASLYGQARQGKQRIGGVWGSRPARPASRQGNGFSASGGPACDSLTTWGPGGARPAPRPPPTWRTAPWPPPMETGEDQRRVGAAARGRRREGSAFLPFGRAAAAKASKRPSEKALLLHVLYLHWGGAQQRHVMMGRRWVRVARSLRLVTQMLAKKKKKARG